MRSLRMRGSYAADSFSSATTCATVDRGVQRACVHVHASDYQPAEATEATARYTPTVSRTLLRSMVLRAIVDKALRIRGDGPLAALAQPCGISSDIQAVTGGARLCDDG